MEAHRNSAALVMKSSVTAPDLDINDLLGSARSASITPKNIASDLGSTVMLPPARCFKGRLLADQNIFSSNGTCLAKMGQVLDVSSAELMAEKKMEENPLNLDQSKVGLKTKRLLADFQCLIKKAPGFERFVDSNGGTSRWQKTLAELLPVYDDGLVYLAHLRDYSAGSYEQSLFCSWLGGVLAQSMQLSQDKVKYSVMAGLFHQLGRLHLPEALRFIAENHCESEQWNDFQYHVIYGKLLVKKAGDVSLQAVTEIIAQQGEYANSLGYPFSLKLSELHKESMLLSLSRDLYQFLFVDGGTLPDCLLFLQLHEARFGQEASWAMQRKIKLFQSECNDDAISACLYSEEMADYLIETSIVLAQLHASTSLIIQPIRRGLKNTDKAYLAAHLLNLLHQIDDYKNNSGIVDIELVAGIDFMKHEEAETLNGEIYQIIQRQRGLLTLFAEVDFLVENALKSLEASSKQEVLLDVKNLYDLIHDALEPFKSAVKNGAC
ncbi:MAG: hypothetical protein JKY01_14450 [Pseudomonadales bacterium]|nr:hypothetical protein [Pseudomonadales bacterium]